MDEKYPDPMVSVSIEMATRDDTLFDDSFDALYRADLRNAKPQEMALVLGMAVGTVMRLRARLKELEGVESRARYTCEGKGGVYRILHRAVGAGTLKELDLLTVYADVSTGHKYVRTVTDFNLRMRELPQ